MHFERQFCIKFFPGKKIKKKHLCLPYLKFSDPLPETHIFFFWPNDLLPMLHRAQARGPGRKKNLPNLAHFFVYSTEGEFFHRENIEGSIMQTKISP